MKRRSDIVPARRPGPRPVGARTVLALSATAVAATSALLAASAATSGSAASLAAHGKRLPVRATSDTTTSSPKHRTKVPAPSTSPSAGPTSSPTSSPSTSPTPAPTTAPTSAPASSPAPAPATSPAGTSAPAPSSSSAPGGVRTWHYTANGVFDGTTYSPGAYGFDLVDVESTWWATHLPAGTMALVWLGLCNGADATFTSTVTPYLNNPGVFGYYLYDEPDPTGQWKTACPAANLQAESDWIHAHDPGKKTFLMLMNMSSNTDPSYQGTYNPANTGIDLYGLDPYPCRSELNGCDYSYITKRVTAALAWGIPEADLVPVFQTFGGGAWVDDGGGSYQLPTADQEQQILATWASVLPHPVFDYAYSWGSQNGDVALAATPALQPIMAQHNAAT